MKKFTGATAATGSLVALLAVVALAVASPGIAGTKPLNAGKNGIKSNAGVGNGTEDVQVGEPSTVTTYSSVYTDSTTSTSGEPTVISTQITKTPIGSTLVGEDRNGQSATFKRYFDVTYQVVTTVGSSTVVTYETVRETKVFKTVTTTTDMADIDPGNSQGHNRAPEGQPEDIVVSSTVLDSTSSEVIASSTESVYETSSTETTSTDYSSMVNCNGSNGQNEGTNYCGNL